MRILQLVISTEAFTKSVRNQRQVWMSIFWNYSSYVVHLPRVTNARQNPPTATIALKHQI